jgi:hypothetical protein
LKGLSKKSILVENTPKFKTQRMLILQHSLGLLFLDFGIKYYFSDSLFFWLCYPILLIFILYACGGRFLRASRFLRYAQVWVFPGFLFPLESPPCEQLAKNYEI